MRIVAGQWRGRRLAALGKGDDAARLRPTPDRVREALFSMLNARGVIDGARVLDLFAGTGALGLEALSRGATFATFVENGRTGARLLGENITLLSADAQHLRADATRMPPGTGDPCDLVFLDPPYGRDMGQKALASAAAQGWLAPGATIVWEESAQMDPPDGFTADGDRRYGDTHLTLLTFAG